MVLAINWCVRMHAISIYAVIFPDILTVFLFFHFCAPNRVAISNGCGKCGCFFVLCLSVVAEEGFDDELPCEAGCHLHFSFRCSSFYRMVGVCFVRHGFSTPFRSFF
jgi:hypothetical protein